MKRVVIGTAGHIDHGKTQLVKALTGIDTDRLREEKERGITIDLGFAHLDLSPDLRVSIVDVPGHERFVKNMVAGASGIDLVLMVIAADEGVMPQTREHLAICQFLGVTRGLVALTKVDLVEKDWLEMVTGDVREFLKGSFLEGAPIVATSAVTGQGLEELRRELVSLCREVPERGGGTVFRMPVDRVFTIKGFGNVVTGTVHSGSLRVGDGLEVLPRRLPVRVRGLQVHGQDVEEVGPGDRAAINLAGVGKEELVRGDVLVSTGAFAPSDFVDATFTLLQGIRPLKNWARVRFHWGTAETMGRVKLLDRDVLNPGEETVVRIHLEEPVVTVPGDAFVVRSFSPVVTIGGGRILDGNPSSRPIKRGQLFHRLGALKGMPDWKRLEFFLMWEADRGLSPWEAYLKTTRTVPVEDVFKELVLRGKGLTLGGRYFHREAVVSLKRRLERTVLAYFQENPLRLYVSREEIQARMGEMDPRVFDALLEEVAGDGKITLSSDGISLKASGPTLSSQEEKWLNFILEEFDRGGWTPPSEEEVFKKGGIPPDKGRALVKLLLERGDLVRVSREILLERRWAMEMVMKVQHALAQKGEMTVGEFKDLLGVSRKYAVPYLEFLDSKGVTRRVGNVRKAKGKGAGRG